MNSKLVPSLVLLSAPWLLLRPAYGQGTGNSSGPGSSGAAPGGGSASGAPGAPAGGENNPASGEAPPAPAPGGTGPGVVYTPPYGYPTGTIGNLNSHLPSSSQPSTDITSSHDGFDIGGGQEGPAVVRGNANGSIALPGERVEGVESAPPVHVVQRGDTLWGLCDRYFQNPWDWPRIWSYNPELQNPHWIYPGDQIRMQPPGAPAPGQPAPGPVGSRPSGTMRFSSYRARVAPNTIFLRDQGYIDDDVKDVWGEVSGSPEDQLLLSDGDNAYLDIKPEHNVRPGQELTIFRPFDRKFKGDAKGTLVAILGTARVEKWDPETHVARAKLIESLDVIERGAKVGPVGRRFEVVAPVRNETELWGHVAASVYPHVLYGQNQVVFIDKGAQDGLVPGNRLFVVTRGDEYRKTLGGASRYAASRVDYESEKPANIEPGGSLGHGDDSKYPEEVVGEIRVLSVRDHTAACIVASALREIDPGQRVVARRGY